ncbi:hypothetical protein AZ029_002232, partial [Klebsiella pneumoniae]
YPPTAERETKIRGNAAPGNGRVGAGHSSGYLAVAGGDSGLSATEGISIAVIFFCLLYTSRCV